MEDYFIIILTLIIAIAGAFNRKKKKNTATPAATEGEEKPSSFWDMLMEEQQVDNAHGMPYDEEEVDYEEEPEVVVPFLEPVPEPKYQFKAEKEGQPVVQKAMEKVVKKKKHVFIDGEKFSLKKAIIYSEIMNRKYT